MRGSEIIWMAAFALCVICPLPTHAIGNGQGEATDQEATESEVRITAFKKPEQKSYNLFVRALSIAEDRGNLAPRADIGFQLVPAQQNRAGVQDILLKLVSTTGEEVIQLDRNGYFHLKAHQAPEDAKLVAQASAGSVRFKPYVRSPGLDEATRRMGDLRIECEMRWEMEKDDLPFLIRTTFQLGGGLCHSSKIAVHFSVDVKLQSADLIDHDRTLQLGIEPNQLGYIVPVHDKNWGNDAKVHLVYAVPDN